MAGARQVTIQFLGDTKGFVSATGKAAGATDKFSSKLKTLGKAAIIGFAGATIAAGKVMYEFAQQAVDDEKAATLLANTLKNTTGATRGQIAATEDWISAQGKALGVTDDDLRPALAKLATATGSLSEAQKDASLSMDVAAGSGKTLSQVSQAMARAISSGSVGALSRYGIETKDAAGKTRDLNDVLKDLAKKYAGDASAAANTASGKFQRLKVDLSETGEAIGYKLLPYADDLGTWLLDTGVPAVQDFARSFKQDLGPMLKDAKTWVSDNKGELKDLAQEVVDVVIPAIQHLGGFVGEAVNFFSGLPDPVKRTGIEAGIAAAIIPKLAGAIDGVTSSVGLSTGKLVGWRKGLLLAAGIAGVGAIVEGAKDGKKSVSILGDALTGAFVGGTLGSAIPIIGTGIGALAGAGTGAAVGLIQMHKAADKAGDSASGATPDVDGLKESLNQLTGATTEATRKMVLLKLEQSGAVDAGAQLGLTSRELVDSVLGQKAAYDKVRGAVRGATLSSTTYLDSQGQVHRANQKSYDAAVLLTKGVDGLGDSLEKSKGEIRATSAATTDYTGKLKGLPVQVKTAITQTGIEPSTKAIADLAKRYNLTPKQIKTVISASNAQAITSVQQVITKMKEVKDKTVTITVQTNHIGGVTSSAGGHTAPGVNPSKHGKVANLDDYRLGPTDQRKAEIAGSALLNSIVRGLKKGERTLHNVMQGLQDYIQTKTDRLNDILSDKNSFVQSFRDAFSESIFSAQFTDTEGNQVPPTLAKMMEFAKQQQAAAHALAANIKGLLAKGLSRDLIQQLVSQGSSGAQQIAALATGSQSDIDQLNATNADIKSTLEGLGTDLYDALNPNAESQIALLTAQVASAQAAEAHLKRIADGLDKDDKIEIKGTDLVILLHKLERATGNKYLVS